MYPSNILDTSLLLSAIEVGTHYYWDIAGISLHGEVFIISWLVIFLILGAAFLATSSLEQIPKGSELVEDIDQNIPNLFY